MSKQPRIRWRQSDEQELKRVVRNFNSKLNRVSKKLDERDRSALPERVSVKELKKLIQTREDLKKEVAALRKFSERGAETLEYIPNNDNNLKITKWQKEVMEARANIINRRRRKRKKEIENIEMTSGKEKLGYKVGMGPIDLNDLKPVEPFTPSMTRQSLKLKDMNLKRESQKPYWDERDTQLKQSYLKGLRENYNEEDIADVLNEIEKMGFKTFYRIFRSGDANFELPYPDKQIYLAFVSKLRSTWVDRDDID